MSGIIGGAGSKSGVIGVLGELKVDDLTLNGTAINSSAEMLLRVNGTDNNAQLFANGNAEFYGTLTKGGGSFSITHPLESKKSTHKLIHSFIEGPKCDLLYRGRVKLNKGSAIVNLDEESKMTEGTLLALCDNLQSFTTNETDFDAVKSVLNGNLLEITSNNSSSNAEISWLVIGERNDEFLKKENIDMCDENGKLIVEKLKTS